MNKKKKVLILGNSHLVVFKFRGELIEKLILNGYKVSVCFPNGPFGEGENTAKQYGCEFIENQMERRGTNPFKDLLIIKEYFKIIKRETPDIVLAYTVKPDVYGGIICRLCKVPFVPNITGLGKGLAEKGLVQKLTILLYKLAVKKAYCVFFQNESDKEFFDFHDIKYHNGIILPGSGVNLDKFQMLPYPKHDSPIKFIYVARVMKAKGIEQYFEAAHVIKQKYPGTEFHVCGYCEENYKDVIKEKVLHKEIIYHGLVDDVQRYEKECHCVVLPSFHPEGISNVLLEGAASGRPLITTDHPGCKETVTDGITGYIVKQQDSNDLINKMEQFIKLPYEEKRIMGINGRKKIEANFNREIVVDQYMSMIKKIIG